MQDMLNHANYMTHLFTIYDNNVCPESQQPKTFGWHCVAGMMANCLFVACSFGLLPMVIFVVASSKAYSVGQTHGERIACSYSGKVKSHEQRSGPTYVKSYCLHHIFRLVAWMSAFSSRVDVLKIGVAIVLTITTQACYQIWNGCCFISALFSQCLSPSSRNDVALPSLHQADNYGKQNTSQVERQRFGFILVVVLVVPFRNTYVGHYFRSTRAHSVVGNVTSVCWCVVLVCVLFLLFVLCLPCFSLTLSRRGKHIPLANQLMLSPPQPALTSSANAYPLHFRLFRGMH